MPVLADVLYLLAWNGYEDQAYIGSMTCREAWEDDRILFPHIINKKFGEQKKSLIGCLTYREFSGRSIPRIERLIGLGADPDVPRGVLRLTPLMETCCLGDETQMDLFKFFLTRANIHGQGGRFTPIAYQSLADNCSIKQQMLLDHGADIHRITNGESVLYTVCDFVRITNLDSIKFLLDHGADPTIECKGGTPLEVCLSNGRVDIAKLLMKYGATIPDSDNCVEAAYNADQENVLKFLVANGKSIDPQLLLDALQNINVKGVRMLLACGACPNTVVAGRPMLFHVNDVDTPEKVEIVRLLCAAGANIHAKESVAKFNPNTSTYNILHEPFLYEMVRQYVRTKNENTFAGIKLLIARGAQAPPVHVYSGMPQFKKNPTQYTHMNILFMKARWKKSEAKTAKSPKV